MNIKHSINLGNSCIRKGHLIKAYDHYNRALLEAFSSKKVFKKWSTPPWPERSYIVNQKYRFIYCPIPKVASTSLNCIMYLLSDSSNKNDQLTTFALSTQQDTTGRVNHCVHDLHRYIHNHLTLENYSRSKSRQIINNKQYFKFTVVRDPWKRLTSAYLNKFVDIKNSHELLLSARTAIEGYYTMNSISPDYDKSITFRQFLSYIAATEDQFLDVHWKTQSSFLENIELNYIAKLETLYDDFEYIKTKIGLKENFILPKQNVTYYALNNDQECNYADFYPSQLRKLERRPNHLSFYTPDLIDLVKQRYKYDFEHFSYNDSPLSK